MGMSRIRFLNCFYDDVDFDEVVNVIHDHIRTRKPGYMVSLNTDIAVRLEDDPAFVAAYEAADLALMDSQPLIWLARLSGLGTPKRLCGSDLMPRLCEVAAREGWSCFICGGREGVPEQAAQNLQDRFPGLRIAGTCSPAYGFEQSPEGIAEATHTVRDSNPDLMFFCLGAPKSEKLLHSHLEEFGVPFSLCVGAAVDFAAGNVHRAPTWVQRAGLEWLYRFFQEPTRLFHRYFIDSWRVWGIYIRYRREAAHARRD